MAARKTQVEKYKDKVLAAVREHAPEADCTTVSEFLRDIDIDPDQLHPTFSFVVTVKGADRDAVAYDMEHALEAYACDVAEVVEIKDLKS